MGFLLFIISWILILPLTIINYIIIWDRGYFRDTALSLDKFANREYRTLWNKVLRKQSGYEFGVVNETISSALGKNQRDGTLTTTGKVLCFILDTIDKDHCRKSINNTI